MLTMFRVVGILTILCVGAAVAQTTKTPQCKTNHCANGGTCYIDQTTNKSACMCPVGFMGPTCAKIDLCAGNPCLNGGTCVPDVATPTFHCNCLPGFSSHNCSTLMYPCAIDPCMNGTCIDHASNTTFTTSCDCFPGYTGVHCETFAGMCSEDPCTGVDSKAQCHDEDKMYQCECSSRDYFGLNCETPSQNCEEEDESYCYCIVHNLPVKIPIPAPPTYDGINTRDVISAILGILLGWLVGTILLHLCCCCFAEEEKEPQRPWSGQSNSTVSSGISSNTVNDPPLTPTSPGGGFNRVAPAATALAPVPKKAQHLPINVYRAAFVDEMTHSVSTRKSTTTYMSGHQDW